LLSCVINLVVDLLYAVIDPARTARLMAARAIHRLYFPARRGRHHRCRAPRRRCCSLPQSRDDGSVARLALPSPHAPRSARTKYGRRRALAHHLGRACLAGRPFVSAMFAGIIGVTLPCSAAMRVGS